MHEVYKQVYDENFNSLRQFLSSLKFPGLQYLVCVFCCLCLSAAGKQLASLSVLPHLAKMVLYGVLFRCLDPVVTIACALSYRDPCKSGIPTM